MNPEIPAEVIVGVLAMDVSVDVSVGRDRVEESSGSDKEAVAGEDWSVVVVTGTVEELVLSGPTRKKFPAIAFPKSTACAKAEILKLVRGVEALTNIFAFISKVEG